jgi:hypothetical protein
MGWKSWRHTSAQSGSAGGWHAHPCLRRSGAAKGLLRIITVAGFGRWRKRSGSGAPVGLPTEGPSDPGAADGWVPDSADSAPELAEPVAAEGWVTPDEPLGAHGYFPAPQASDGFDAGAEDRSPTTGPVDSTGSDPGVHGAGTGFDPDPAGPHFVAAVPPPHPLVSHSGDARGRAWQGRGPAHPAASGALIVIAAAGGLILLAAVIGYIVGRNSPVLTFDEAVAAAAAAGPVGGAMTTPPTPPMSQASPALSADAGGTPVVTLSPSPQSTGSVVTGTPGASSAGATQQASGTASSTASQSSTTPSPSATKSKSPHKSP